jgi:hypothetical protein
MLRVATAIVRAWTTFYTWRMSATLRQERCAEIESDLWEFQQDRTESGSLEVAAQMLLRLVLGVPDDLGWRLEHTANSIRSEGRSMCSSSTASRRRFLIRFGASIGVSVHYRSDPSRN